MQSTGGRRAGLSAPPNCIAAPAASAAGRSSASSPARSAGSCGQAAWNRRRSALAVTIAAERRAAATIGPKIMQVATAAGSDRADGPLPQPHPRNAAAPGRRSRRATIAAASTKGVASKSVLAAEASAPRSKSGEKSSASASGAAP